MRRRRRGTPKVSRRGCSTTARPGNALFVDGACAEGDEGYLDRNAVVVVAGQLAAEAAVGSARSAARPVDGRYPDDRPRRGFRFGVPATPPAA